MEIAIDPAGRLVLPKGLREFLGLRGKDVVEVEQVGNHLEIRKKGAGVRVEDRGGWPVLVAEATAPPATVSEIRDLVEEGREWPRAF